ncbi:MAG: preprotein translocase subunit SecA [Bacteroidia bacterium]
MLGFVSKAINSIFGNKSERDIKQLLPRVDEINTHYAALKSLSNDELRAKTQEFKQRIADGLADLDQQLESIKAEVEKLPASDVEGRFELYSQIDKLEKERDEQLESLLDHLLPEAFAVVKETARRFTENETLEVTATQADRDLAATKDFVRIEGDKAIYQNRWMAAGSEVVWNMIHYDVQLIGGMVLHGGKIAEMATGEGKTLVSTLPAYLNALSGMGVHLVTVNDYLAKRDAEWNGPLFQFHGLTVDCIDKHQPNSPHRRQAYLADITYGTNNEFGFDYLRDNMAHAPEALVQRKHHFAMVDEVDSVLIDDARTPLIISGPVPRGDIHEFQELKPRIERLVDAQKRFVNTALADAKKLLAAGNTQEGGLALFRAYRGLPKNKALIKFLSESGMRAQLQKTESIYLENQQKEMHKADEPLFFTIDEKNNTIELTEKGIELITATGEDTSFFIMPDVGAEVAEIEKSELTTAEKADKKAKLMADFQVKSERIHTMNQLLKAYCLFERDVEYIVDQNKVKIVDEQTGRVLDGRRYSDGLHQAIEAKENVKVEAATQTFATVTLQNFFRMYHKLAGMTGTAETEAGELWEIYKLDVVVIPTNRPIVRKDVEDMVYKTIREKYNAIIDETVKLVEAGRPVLVGTTSVETSELLSRMLTLRKIKHNVLNAKQHQREADIVAEAGRAGTVTIATNMAGRGTDIKLGPGVKEAGGLAIIGTERHESRRVDRQLRGRAGRQGDPGSSQFFVSLEDNLMRLFGSERISKVMDTFGYKEGEVIQHSMITKSIERAQKKVEENNFGIRKRLLEYDDVMNSQREVIYRKRRHALYGERLNIDIRNMISDVATDLVERHRDAQDYEAFQLDVIRMFALETKIDQETFLKAKLEQLSDSLAQQALAAYDAKNERVALMAQPVINSVFEQKGDTVENIVVPFQMGNKGMQVGVNLKKAYETECREIITEFEKGIMLMLIDESWKNHLRDMDELKQSVQNAVYEQKDPLVVYKMESFNLFERMLTELNSEATGMLFQGTIPVQNPEQVREQRPMPRAPQPQLQANKPAYTSSSSAPVGGGQPMPQAEAPRPVQPVHVGPKIGRNDPCPCGSGKKFKACHGKEQ